MIVRRNHRSRFTIVPNAIWEDRRLSIEAKGVLAYLLSRPHDWNVRHDQLQKQLGIGRKWLERIMRELIAAGYVTRDDEQARDDQNRFQTLNYVVNDVPENGLGASKKVPDVPIAHRRRPLRDTDIGTKKEVTKDGSDKAADEDALNIADEVMKLAGLDPSFPPPSWCGASLRVRAWLDQGWQSEIIFVAVKRVMTRKLGAPNSIAYFEQAIADEIGKQSKPLPKPALMARNSQDRKHAPANSVHAAIGRIRERLAEPIPIAEGDAGILPRQT